MVDGNVRRENYVAIKDVMHEYTAEPRKSHTGQLNTSSGVQRDTSERRRESNETRRRRDEAAAAAKQQQQHVG